MPHVRSAPTGPVPGVSRSYDLVMASCEDGMDSSSDDPAPDLDVEGEGGDVKKLSNVVVKPEPVHCEGDGCAELAGAGPATGASASCDLAVASSEPVNDDEQGGDSTECSSSFGDSGCETDDEADHGDPEVDSPFSAHAVGDQSSPLPRKKKVTSEWRKAVRPMLWRCQWLELRMKDLLSQVSKYDKQLALIKQEKELQQAVTKTNGSRTESWQLCKGHGNSSMDRIKRKRHEDTMDTLLCIKKHQILSYFYDKQNKGAETDGLLVDDDSNDPVGDDIKGGLDTAGLPEKSKEYDMVSEQLTLQKILLTIGGIQSQVHRLQERLSKARSKQEKLASFVDHAQVMVAEKRQRTQKHPFSYKNEYDRYSKPQKKKNLNILLKEEGRPALGVISTLSERATDCLIQDANGNSEEKSGERCQSHNKAITVDLLLDVNSSLPNGHMGDLCREMAGVADWNDDNTRIVCELFAEQVSIGNRSNTHLSNVGYAALEKRFKERTGLEYNKRQFKNKWDKLKSEWTTWNRLLMRETGAGWDNVKGTIKMDSDWWTKAKADIPGCSKYRKQGIQNSDLLRVMFEDITNDGADHWSPAGGKLPQPPQETPTINVDVEDDMEVVDETEHEDSPTVATAKRAARVVANKGKKAKIGSAQVMQDQITRIADITEKSQSTFESYANKDDPCSIKLVMDMVVECGATWDSNEHFIATELFVKREQREMFVTMPALVRFNWLKRKYNAKYGS